jgi:5-methylcytosine-specific restriction endonuclease McrA
MSFNYSHKLKNPRWQRKRLEILSRDNWSCKNCGDCENELHVHHKEYISGYQPWEYPDEYYITLCKSCHNGIHNKPSEIVDDYPSTWNRPRRGALDKIREKILIENS